MAHQIASGMPNASIDVFRMIDQLSWLSTQVYTPFGRKRPAMRFFLVFSQVPAVHSRKVVCQNFPDLENEFDGYDDSFCAGYCGRLYG